MPAALSAADKSGTIPAKGPSASTLVGYIDDATGRVTGATFRDQEGSAGHLEAL